MESRSLRFAATARTLAEVARAQGHVAPAFRSPPRVRGRNRTVTRHAGGSVTVAVVVRDRPWSAVVADMIEGFVVANRLGVAPAEALRDRLWAAIEEIDLTAASDSTPPRRVPAPATLAPVRTPASRPGDGDGVVDAGDADHDHTLEVRAAA